MKFSELPQEWQNKLAEDRIALALKRINTPYEIEVYNAQGTRYFVARRVCIDWTNDRGGYMPFGGGSYWTISYGAVQFRSRRNPCGEVEYELCKGKTYGASANGTKIPNNLHTKREVLDLLKSIGIFDI